MVGRIPVTHGWSILVIILKLLTLIVFALFIIFGTHKIIPYRSEYVDILLGVGIILSFNFFFTKYFFALSTLLYVRISLRTPISYNEALKISYFFEPNDDGQWFAMKNLLDVPKEFRRRVLFETIEEMSDS